MSYHRVSYGQVAVRQAIDAKDMPDAGPVRTYRIEEEEFETKIARNLQTIIRIGKPQMVVEKEARQDAIREIIKACLRELDKYETTQV
ncbi:hypothetical protein JCM15765_00530 [Paradesulfitobacterium aromaticivorans]